MGKVFNRVFHSLYKVGSGDARDYYWFRSPMPNAQPTELNWHVLVRGSLNLHEKVML